MLKWFSLQQPKDVNCKSDKNYLSDSVLGAFDHTVIENLAIEQSCMRTGQRVQLYPTNTANDYSLFPRPPGMSGLELIKNFWN